MENQRHGTLVLSLWKGLKRDKQHLYYRKEIFEPKRGKTKEKRGPFISGPLKK